MDDEAPAEGRLMAAVARPMTDDSDLAPLLAASIDQARARRLRARHAQVERLLTERERLRHQPAPTLETELRAALLAFYADACPALGLGDDR